MAATILGLTGFALFFIYDINSFTRQSALVHRAFALGAVLVALSALLSLADAWRQGAFAGIGDALCLALGALCLAAMVYCLFFALPFDATYREQSGVRAAYTGGAYALCRHPGVVCFWGAAIFWGLAALPSRLWLLGAALSLCNTLYAWFQDRVTFPKLFSNYADYRGLAPFLLPTAGSIRRALRTWGAPADEEVEK